jgi:hypothetical protein
LVRSRRRGARIAGSRIPSRSITKWLTIPDAASTKLLEEWVRGSVSPETISSRFDSFARLRLGGQPPAEGGHLGGQQPDFVLPRADSHQVDGSFLVRDSAQLYTQEDVLGIVLRLSFEKEGYEPLEVTVAVERNALAEVHPILWRPEETPQGNDWCIVVQGTVSAAGRKRVKKALVTITSPLDPGFELQAKVGKNGTYRALLWNAPASLKISATAAGFSSVESTLILKGAPRTNMVAQVAQDLVLAP